MNKEKVIPIAVGATAGIASAMITIGLVSDGYIEKRIAIFVYWAIYNLLFVLGFLISNRSKVRE